MNDVVLQLLEDGFRLHQAGHLDEAEQRYRAALEADGQNADALNLLGMLCVNSFRPEEAVLLLSRALKRQPNHPESHANIALAYKDQGKLELAVKHFREALRLDQWTPVVHNNLGNVLRELGRPKEAIKAYETALKLDGEFAACWSNLGAACNEADRHKAAHRAIDRALALEPRLAQAHNNRGDILLAEARYEEALHAYREATRLNPKYVTALINMARTQRDMDDAEAALATLRRAIELEPRNPEARHALGVLHEQVGQSQAAVEAYQAAISVAPAMAIAHYYLSQVRGRRVSDEEFAAMQKIWDEVELLPNDRMFLAFGLSRAHEHRQDFDRAFDFLSAGNRIKAGMQPYDDADTARFLGSLADTAEAAIARLGPAPGCADLRPVFVLGMPRSGTSLTEQILASHSQIAGAGELSYAYDAAHRVRELTGRAFPQNLTLLSHEQWRGLGEYYLSRHRAANLEQRHVVDKTPLNFQYIGMLALALPQAKFIHCYREPVQNCFSIHRLPFDKKQAYAHDLSALGRYYRHYWTLMQRWKTLFPGRILDVRYEDMVADIEGQSRRMLDFLGVEFEPGVLEFHATTRLVKTPSAAQVRQPIYTEALDSWRNYEHRLTPLIENLQELASPGAPQARQTLVQLTPE